MWFFVFIGLLASDSALGDNSTAELAIIDDARDGALEQYGLLESALTLSGIAEPQQRSEAISRFNQIAFTVRSNPTPLDKNEFRAQQFVTQLHSSLLSGKFDPECDGLDKAFNGGNYNCVISLILTLEYCRREGIPAHAMQHENHVWLRIEEDGGLDVETTKLQMNQDSLARGSRISDTQLLTRLLYNQARRRHQLRRFDQAVKRLEWCLILDPTFKPAERNLRIVLGNWIVNAAEDFSFSEALAVNSKAIARFPHDESLRHNTNYLEQRWAKWREITRETTYDRASNANHSGSDKR